ncbi:group II intron reverse transcriptase/maturase [Pyxidicoccus sp. 3LG]
MRENREVLSPPTAEGAVGRIGKADGRTPVMHGGRKSDGLVVPTKLLNKAAGAAEEAVEGRGPAQGNQDQQNAPRTQCRTRAPSALDRVRRAARRDKEAKFTALLHHVTVDRLREAFMALRRNAAPGVDGVTWEAYREGLEGNLQALHGRLHTGAYRARPSRRVYIPKADGRQRPLGIAALEDKLVQRAVVEVMNAIYEGDFLGFSYGFRPGRSQHQSLDALAVGLLRKKVNWVLDADIRGFFDAINHEWLMKFVQHRIADERVLRLIQKWLSAGVMEKGTWAATEEGTPQGATASPLLANIYLHYVFDLWIQQWRWRHARGDVIVTRYADDFIVGFQHRTDAEQFLERLRERFRKFSLELHPEKTRLIEFGRMAAERRKARGLGKPETFNYLGLTHLCARTKAGKFLLQRQTMRKRMRAKLSEVKAELQRRRHLPIPEQGAWLAGVVRGYFAYHGVPTNTRAMSQFRSQVIWHWHRALKRRGQRDRTCWERMSRLVRRWLPLAKKQHPWPEERFDVRTRGKSRMR